MSPRAPTFPAAGAWTAIPGIGPATAGDLLRLGYTELRQLKRTKPLALYRALCKKTGVRQDPCVLDVFMMLVHLADTGESRPWWRFTKQRKAKHPEISAPPSKSREPRRAQQAASKRR